jgi:hypothetical protein
MTPEQLDAVADVMLPVAADLVCRVRDRDQAAIADTLTPMNVMHLRSLVVVLAAMVPDDRPLNDLIAWTRGAPETVPLGEISPKRAARNRAALAYAVGAHDDYTPHQKGAAA